MSNRRYTREFSYTRPIMYQGEWYPSADTVVSDDNGVERKGRMFTDSNGNYFTLDENGNAMEAMPIHQLEDTVVTAPIIDAATKKQKENYLQRQAMMRAAGYNVPSDGSWDNQQEFLWNNLTTKSKEYDTTLSGLVEGLWDKATNNSTYRTNPTNPGYVRTYDPDNIDWEKTRRSQSKVVDALSGTWGPGLVMAGLPSLMGTAISAPIATAATMGGGTAGGWAVNKASEALTGRDFGTNVAMHTSLTPGMGEILNPGYVAGGYGTERRMLDALYNQVTPIGYGNNNTFSWIGGKNKAQELGLAVKDFFTPKRIRTSVDDIPAWRQRIDFDSDVASRMPAKYTNTLRATVDLRDDAWRLAMRQQPRILDVDGSPHTLYNKNQDGTYSYDFDYIDKVRKNIGTIPLVKDRMRFSNSGEYHEGLNRGVAKDAFTTNGGNIGIELKLPKDYDNPNSYNNLNVREPYRIYDKWDLQPLKDEGASIAPAFSRWLTRHPNKVTNYIKNMDVLEAVGGNPFMLDMQVKPNIIGIYRNE